jgi:thiol-disulfide isomerase/thioredoxin
MNDWKNQSDNPASKWISENLEPKGCLLGAGALYVLAAILAVAGGLAAVWLWGQREEDLGSRKIRLQTVQLTPLLHAEAPIRLEDLQGKVVVLNFWGTWCPPCLMELPHLAELERTYRGREGFLFLAVSCGPGPQEDLEEIRSSTAALLANQGFDMPTYLDPDFQTRRAVDQAVGFQGYPTTLLLDRQGYIRRIWVGFDRRLPHELTRLVQQLLAEGP